MYYRNGGAEKEKARSITDTYTANECDTITTSRMGGKGQRYLHVAKQAVFFIEI